MKSTLHRGLTDHLVLIGFGLLLGGCSTLQTSANTLVERDGDTSRVIAKLNPRYEPSKLAVGLERDLMNKRANSYGIISLPEINDYLNGIRSRLVKASGVREVPGKVYLSADPQIEGHATPDGNIYISWALLQYLGSEDAVAGLIAHELSHVLLLHCDSSVYGQYIQKSRWMHQHGANLLLDVTKYSKQTDHDGTTKKAVTQHEALKLAVAVTTKVASPSWQRTQERSADLLGTDLLVAAGYNPDGMLDMLKVLKQYAENNRKAPDLDRLAKNLTSLQQSNVWLKLQGGVGAMEMLWGHSHPEVGTRITDVQDYLDRQYDDTELKTVYQKSSWNKIERSRSFRALLKSFEGAIAAEKLLDLGQYQDAYKQSKNTIGSATNQAYPAYIFGLTLEKVGKEKEALVAYKRAILAEKTKEGSGKIYQKVASQYSRSGNNAAATQVMRQGYEQFGKAPQLVPEVIRYQRLSGDAKGASDAAIACTLDYPEYADDCVKAANPT